MKNTHAFALCFLYMVLGFALSIPYCILAGWDRYVCTIVAMLAPAYAFVWLLLAGSSRLIRVYDGNKLYFNWRTAFREGESSNDFLPIFWGWTMTGLLPIFCNLASKGLYELGYKTGGSFLYEHRYHSPFATIAIAFVLIVLAGSLRNFWQNMIKNGP